MQIGLVIFNEPATDDCVSTRAVTLRLYTEKCVCTKLKQLIYLLMSTLARNYGSILHTLCRHPQQPEE